MHEADRTALLRIMDANGNRAAEALRVVEDYARFILEDPHLSSLTKQLRHDLTTTLAVFPHHERIAARDTTTDVGTRIWTDDEYVRPDTDSVVRGNLKRAEQSLRCLEEFAKPIDSAAAEQLESLRYRAYTLARAVETTAASRDRLDGCRLYVLIDGGDSVDDFTRKSSELIEAGADAVQLRDKRLADRDLIGRGHRLRELTESTATRFIMNDRPDLARLCRADGVHLGQDDMTARQARTILGGSALIGVSTHNIDQARQAVVAGADYLGCGPTFPSATKTFDDFPGLEFLRQVADEIGLPAFAIGGIDQSNIDNVLATGFRRVAVSSAVWQASDLGQAASHLRDELSRLPE